MDSSLADDVRRFFRIHEGRISDVMMRLPPQVRKELEEEITLIFSKKVF